MTDPETLKQILKDAKEEIEEWPEWMKSQEPCLKAHTVKTGDAPESHREVKLSS
jgi:hypothetical protein